MLLYTNVCKTVCGTERINMLDFNDCPYQKNSISNQHSVFCTQYRVISTRSIVSINMLVIYEYCRMVSTMPISTCNTGTRKK